jgi:hypothetical protein
MVRSLELAALPAGTCALANYGTARHGRRRSVKCGNVGEVLRV